MQILWVINEPEEHGGCVVRLQTPVLGVHYSLNDARLPHVPHVHCRLEPGEYRRGVIHY